MPFPHQRRLGATVLFRRKIPCDLRDRFGCGEIVRSLGRVTPGEARRLAHHLWSQTEVAFMFVRRVPGMTREKIGRVVDVTVSEFRDQLDLAIADVRPGVAKAWLDEPAQVAAGLVGAATVLDHSLSRGDLAAMGQKARACAADLLNTSLEPDNPEERRLARAMASALRDEMQGASQAFEALAQERPKSDRLLVREVRNSNARRMISRSCARARSRTTSPTCWRDSSRLRGTPRRSRHNRSRNRSQRKAPPRVQTCATPAKPSRNSGRPFAPARW